MPQYEMNLRDYWRIVRKRKLVLVGTFLVISGTSLYFSRSTRTVYRATSEVRIIQRVTTSDLLTRLTVPVVGNPLLTAAESIKNERVLRRVAIELGKVSADTPDADLRKAIESLRSKLQTRPLEGTDIIQIIATSDVPTEATLLANTVAQAYREEDFNEKQADARRVQEFIEGRLKEISAQLSKAEDTLREIKEKYTTSGMAGPIQAKRLELEAELRIALEHYTEEHPTVKGLREQSNALDRRLKELPKEELELAQVNRERDSLIDQQADFQRRLRDATVAVQDTTHDVIIQNLARVAAVAVGASPKMRAGMGCLAGIILGFVAALVWEHLDSSLGTIEDVEDFLKVPVVGVIPYMHLESDKAGPWFWKKAKPHAGEHRASEHGHRESDRLLVHFSGGSSVVEAYRALRTNLQYAGFDTGGKCLAITSSGPGEGKSLTATNLAITYAQSGRRVLLMSADMRRPTLHRYFGLKRAPGLSEVVIGSTPLRSAVRTLADVLIGDTQWDELLRVPGMDNLSILTSGYLPPNPVEILGSESMVRLIAELKESLDILLIDCPPVLPVADASVLAPKVDGMVLVYQAGKIARNALLRAKIQVENVGGSVKGVVLNYVKPQMEAGETYYYRYRYYGEGAKHSA